MSDSKAEQRAGTEPDGDVAMAVGGEPERTHSTPTPPASCAPAAEKDQASEAGEQQQQQQQQQQKDGKASAQAAPAGPGAEAPGASLEERVRVAVEGAEASVPLWTSELTSTLASFSEEAWEIPTATWETLAQSIDAWKVATSALGALGPAPSPELDTIVAMLALESQETIVELVTRIAKLLTEPSCPVSDALHQLVLRTVQRVAKLRHYGVPSHPVLPEGVVKECSELPGWEISRWEVGKLPAINDEALCTMVDGRRKARRQHHRKVGALAAAVALHHKATAPSSTLSLEELSRFLTAARSADAAVKKAEADKRKVARALEVQRAKQEKAEKKLAQQQGALSKKNQDKEEKRKAMEERKRKAEEKKKEAEEKKKEAEEKKKEDEDRKKREQEERERLARKQSITKFFAIKPKAKKAVAPAASSASPASAPLFKPLPMHFAPASLSLLPPRELPSPIPPAVPLSDWVVGWKATRAHELKTTKIPSVPEGCMGGRVKLLSFHDNHRPDFWGTFSRRSDSVGARRPLSQDAVTDYEADSDGEWESEGEGEELDSEGDAEDEEMPAKTDLNADDDDESDDEDWCVPDGYLSDGEGVDAAGDGDSDGEEQDHGAQSKPSDAAAAAATPTNGAPNTNRDRLQQLREEEKRKQESEKAASGGPPLSVPKTALHGVVLWDKGTELSSPSPSLAFLSLFSATLLPGAAPIAEPVAETACDEKKDGGGADNPATAGLKKRSSTLVALNDGEMAELVEVLSDAQKGGKAIKAIAASFKESHAHVPLAAVERAIRTVSEYHSTSRTWQVKPEWKRDAPNSEQPQQAEAGAQPSAAAASPCAQPQQSPQAADREEGAESVDECASSPKQQRRSLGSTQPAPVDGSKSILAFMQQKESPAKQSKKRPLFTNAIPPAKRHQPMAAAFPFVCSVRMEDTPQVLSKLAFADLLKHHNDTDPAQLMRMLQGVQWDQCSVDPTPQVCDLVCALKREERGNVAAAAAQEDAARPTRGKRKRDEEIESGRDGVVRGDLRAQAWRCFSNALVALGTTLPATLVTDPALHLAVARDSLRHSDSRVQKNALRSWACLARHLDVVPHAGSGNPVLRVAVTESEALAELVVGGGDRAKFAAQLLMDCSESAPLRGRLAARLLLPSRLAALNAVLAASTTAPCTHRHITTALQNLQQPFGSSGPAPPPASAHNNSSGNHEPGACAV